MADMELATPVFRGFFDGAFQAEVFLTGVEALDGSKGPGSQEDMAGKALVAEDPVPEAEN